MTLLLLVNLGLAASPASAPEPPAESAQPDYIITFARRRRGR